MIKNKNSKTSTNKPRGLLSEAAKHIFLILFCAFSLGPLLWIISTSFKDITEVAVWPPIFFSKLKISAYLELFDRTMMARYLVNTIFIATCTALLTLIISSLAAYGLGRFRFKGAKFILSAFLISQMFPGASIMIPVTKIILGLGLFNSLFGLILIHTAFLIPFSTWMLYGYFTSIPTELEEAAFIDGCSRFDSLIKIIIPLAIPGFGAVFIFSFLGSWNEFLFALVLTNTDKVRTLSVGLASLIGQYHTSWNVLSAGALLFAIPPLILFLWLEKSLLSGLTAGAMKG